MRCGMTMIQCMAKGRSVRGGLFSSSATCGGISFLCGMKKISIKIKNIFVVLKKCIFACRFCGFGGRRPIHSCELVVCIFKDKIKLVVVPNPDFFHHLSFVDFSFDSCLDVIVCQTCFVYNYPI